MKETTMTPIPPQKKYEVTCITIYTELASSAEEAKKIIESNCPDQYQYMIAKKVIP
jgi:hypothetical protein